MIVNATHHTATRRLGRNYQTGDTEPTQSILVACDRISRRDGRPGWGNMLEESTPLVKVNDQTGLDVTAM